MRRLHLAAMLAAALLAVPAAAQRSNTLPVAATLTGAERIYASQGSGCATNVAPCAAVNVLPTQIATFVSGSFQPKDADLDAIAALSTQSFGRSLLTQADAAAVRSAIGLGSIATQASNGVAITGGSVAGITDLAVADGGTAASTAQAAAANLSVGWVACRSGTAVAVTGTTSEATQAICSIPAGAIGANGVVEVSALSTFSGTAGAKVTRIRFGGVEVWSNTNAAANLAIRTLFAISNSGSASSQIALNVAAGVGVTANAAQVVRSSVNTANPVSLTITCQPAATADTCTLESYLVRVTFGA